ncbi:oligopeptide/dipeptide ABC transporter ATP-binding protein [Leucobacter soli]|uniref:oligopeptide/dipeptide ABC transporter ATP-binding protein n=1 Tax=Leucobacter soli TaxID=2812850 RepID=UPI003609547F
MRAVAADRGRADDRARRDRAGGHHRTAPLADAADRHRGHDRDPRPRRALEHRRPSCGFLRGRGRRDLRGFDGVHEPDPPVHGGAARRGAARQRARRDRPQADARHAPSAGEWAQGCRFNPRCEYAQRTCYIDQPKLLEFTPGHEVACHVRGVAS